MNDLVALLVVFANGEEEEEDPQLAALCSELEQKALKSAELVCLFNHSLLYISYLMNAQERELNNLNLKGFKKEDGPFVHALDQALATFNATRQVYHGGAFAGNDVHRSLRVIKCRID